VADAIDLPHPAPEPAAADLAASALSAETLGQLLGALTCRPGPLPKYLYPSAGTLYPVHAEIRLATPIPGLAAGCWRYDPHEHALVLTADAPPPSPPSLLLVAELAAITPIYADRAEAFCLLEAGYMIAALHTHAAACGLRLHRLPLHAVNAAITPGAGHLPLACLALEPSA
jgi:hypothetical protein